MRRSGKNVVRILLMVLLTVGFMTVTAQAEEVETDETGKIIRASGTDGDNITWTFEDGVLTISGTGPMVDRDSTYWVRPYMPPEGALPPWQELDIRNVYIQEGVTSVGASAFWKCRNIESVALPESVTTIGESAFNGCTNVISINVPEGVTRIGKKAFLGCNSLESINIPDGVTEIEYRVFSNCKSLTSIDIPDGVTKIGVAAFYNCEQLISVDIPEGVTIIRESTFEECENLTSVRIPYGVHTIEQWAFAGCHSLQEVEIPRSVKRMKYYAFSTCSSLTSVTIPRTVTDIDSNAFENCPNVTIYGAADSYAEEFARKTDIPFVVIEMFPFNDVSDYAWYYDVIEYVWKHGIMDGKTEELFAPDENLTREQFTVMLHRLEGLPEVIYTAKFTDVPDGQWYTSGIMWAQSAGVVEGLHDDLFGTSQSITREQMVTMMYRYAKYKGYDVNEKTSFESFPDAHMVSDYAEEAMKWAVGSGLIEGKHNGRLDPLGTATRAESAAVFMRLMEKYEK